MIIHSRWPTPTAHEVATSDSHVLDALKPEQFEAMVNQAGLSNADWEAEAISLADSHSFWAVHPEIKNNEENRKLINDYLTANGIIQCTFPHFVDVTSALKATGQLALNANVKPPQTFKSTLTGETYGDEDTLIKRNRFALLSQKREQSAAEKAFEDLPNEQALPLLRQAEQRESLQANGRETSTNCDAWLTLHPEIVDNTRNAHLIKAQLRIDGVPDGKGSIEQVEISARKLLAGGLLTLKPGVVAKQRAAEVKQRATEAVKMPGSVWDNTSEEEMERLSLDELRTRANRQLASGR